MEKEHIDRGEGNAFSSGRPQAIKIDSDQFRVWLSEIADDAERRRRDGENERPYLCNGNLNRGSNYE